MVNGKYKTRQVVIADLRREGLILAMKSIVLLGLQGVDRPDELPEWAESLLKQWAAFISQEHKTSEIPIMIKHHQ